MSTQLAHPAPSPAAPRQACPRCGRPLYRVPRHVIDLLISRLTPVRRYHCTDPACGWEGRQSSGLRETLESRRYTL